VTRAYVALGSNLGDRERTIRDAAELIGARRLSTIRETEPWGVEGHPRYLNAVAEVETELTPRALLDRLLAVEAEFGRVRSGDDPHGPRTLDLDLLLYGDERIDEPGLTLPHARLHERRFVLEPLAELAPEAVVPGRGEVQTLLAGLH